MSILRMPTGLMIAELKKYLADLPEVNPDTGKPFEVWIETSSGNTSPCVEVWPLDKRPEGQDIVLKYLVSKEGVEAAEKETLFEAAIKEMVELEKKHGRDFVRGFISSLSKAYAGFVDAQIIGTKDDREGDERLSREINEVLENLGCVFSHNSYGWDNHYYSKDGVLDVLWEIRDKLFQVYRRTEDGRSFVDGQVVASLERDEITEENICGIFSRFDKGEKEG